MLIKTELRLISSILSLTPSDNCWRQAKSQLVVSRSLGFQITKIVTIFEKKKKKKTLITDCLCSVSIRPTTNMINHDNTATFCEIRNCVNILLGMVSHIEFLYSFIWILMKHSYSNCSGLCCEWILNTCMKKYDGNTSVYMIKHISMFYLEVSM